MSYEETIEARAKMGLRVIAYLYKLYPGQGQVTPWIPLNKDQLNDPLEEEESDLAIDLIFRMFYEGVIVGEKNNADVVPATLPARVRNALQTRDPNGIVLLIASVEAALKADETGDRISRGEFTRMARVIGFEP